MIDLYPLKLNAAFKPYIWGGTKLRTCYNKVCDFDKIAESWELSCHKDGESTISNGEFSGKTLSQYFEEVGFKALGTHGSNMKEFPILIKIIDAKENLSIQVHPSDAYAMEFEGGLGKTEMWYVIECDEDASIAVGFNRKISREEFINAIDNSLDLDFINNIPIKKGDAFLIEAGTIHAIGKGALIAEVQQNSNLTYRVYDYNRVEPNGEKRELHLDKALSVLNFTPFKEITTSKIESVKGNNFQKLAECPYFSVTKIEVDTNVVFFADDASFNSLLFLEGKGKILYNGDSIEFDRGESIFIPANFGEYTILGNCELLLTKI